MLQYIHDIHTYYVMYMYMYPLGTWYTFCINRYRCTCVVACLLKHVQQSVCFLRTTQRKFIVNDVHWPHDQNSCPIMKSTGGNNE